MWEGYFNDILETPNFCKKANTQPLVKEDLAEAFRNVISLSMLILL